MVLIFFEAIMGLKVNVVKSEIDIGQGGTTNSDLKHQGRSGIAWVLKDYG